MKGASRGCKVSSGFPGCKDPRGRRGNRDKRVTLENPGCLERKGREDPRERRATPETQDCPVFLAKTVPPVLQVSPDAMGQRASQGLWGPRVCLDSPEIPDHQDYQE